MGTTLGRIFLSLFTLLFIVPILLVRCQPRAEGGTGILVRLHRVDQRRTYIMDLEEYLKGVVAAEMPAAFHPEALKAQAVAARTVTVRRLLRYGGKGSKYDPSADFSDDPVEGQAWLSQRDLRRRWGWRAYSANWAKVSRAVEETKGLILTYQGRPIDAVYHSTSGPRTEAAHLLEKRVAIPASRQGGHFQPVRELLGHRERLGADGSRRSQNCEPAHESSTMPNLRWRR